MNRRHITHVAAVFTVAILARIALFEYAGIWGDWGFYAYNAELIAEGQTPFVDFVGRSPLHMYTYSLVSRLGDQAYLLRGFIIFWWVLASAPVYLFARHIHSHHAGVFALVAYLLMPFSVTYGFWANTQSMAAFLLITGFYLLVRFEDWRGYTLFGSCLGLAFLARRSVIVAVAAVAAFVAYEWYRGRYSLKTGVVRLTAAYTTAVAVLAVAYLLMARGDITLASKLAETHAVALVSSSGRGGYALINAPPSPAVTSSGGSIPVFHDLCQKCGTWTMKTFAKTMLLIMPVLGFLLYYFRDWTDRWFEAREKQYLGGILGALALYACYLAFTSGYYVRVLTLVAFGLFTLVVYRTDPIEPEILYQREMVLLLLFLSSLSAGYLYRNRLIHTYYFMDFWPAISIVTGVVALEAVRRADVNLRALLAIALVASLISSSAGAYPITNVVLDGNDGGWFTVESVQEYGDDMDARTDPGDVVLAANPSYVALSDAEMPHDNSRIYYTLVSYKDTGPGRELYGTLIDGFRSGRIRYVVETGLVTEMLAWNATAQQAYRSHYCPVDSDGLYEQTNARLMQWTENASQSC